MPDLVCERRAVFFLATPEMKGVSENDIAENASWIVVAEIDRWVELKIACDVAGETDGRRVFGSALPIHLHPPRLIEVVGIAENRFVFVSCVNCSDDHLVMLGIVPSLNIWLRIYIQMRRPVRDSSVPAAASNLPA